MKRIAALWLLVGVGGCGAPEIAVTAAPQAITADKSATATAAARDDADSNPMPGQPPSPADTPTAPVAAPAAPTASNAGSNPMPGQPAGGTPSDPFRSNPMPGLAAAAATLDTK